MQSEIWNYGQVDESIACKMAYELNISPLTARVLVSRGYRDAQGAKSFLDNASLNLYDPFLLKDMDKAVDCIKNAITAKKRVCVYGDYDVDGVTSTTLLCDYLRSRGVDCSYYIPERIKEGYGLNINAIERIAQNNDVIITVDTGITATQEVLFANSLGLQVVITDHHTCRDELPAAVAVVDPHRHDDKYPFKSLAGVGVVFKLVCALEGDSEKIMAEYSDIIAIGTVADVMPLVDENRLVVSAGLKLLEHTKRKGLLALMARAGVLKRGKRITASAIGFAIAPRLNAAGRISSAIPALRLLLEEDSETACRLADELCEINLLRQQTEREITEDALKQIGAYKKDTYAYVLVSESWHQGVIGVVASKISEKYHIPVILFSYSDDKTIARGSARSVSGFNLVEALSKCSDLLLEYGGHELAAGLTVKSENIELFCERFEKIAKAELEGKDVSAPLKIDCEVKFNEINVNNASELQALEPFGLGNPTPMLMLKGAVIEDIVPVSEDKHIRLTVRDASGGRSISCMYFGMSHSEFPFCRGDVCELAFTLELNEYNGIVSTGVLVRSVRPCKDERDAIILSRRHYDILYSELITEKLPVSVLPTLDDFRTVFRVLRRELGDSRKRVSVRYIKRKIELTEGEKTNLCALKIILDVLCEFGLVDCLRIRSNDIVELELLPYSQKVDLMQSAILKKVRYNLRKGGESDDLSI